MQNQGLRTLTNFKKRYYKLIRMHCKDTTMLASNRKSLEIMKPKLRIININLNKLIESLIGICK